MTAKKELKDINLWEVTGRLTTTFALMGALAGPGVLLSTTHVIPHYTDQPVKELTVKDFALASAIGARDGAASGLFAAAVAIPLLWQMRKKAAKEQSPSAQ